MMENKRNYPDLVSTMFRIKYDDNDKNVAVEDEGGVVAAPTESGAAGHHVVGRETHTRTFSREQVQEE
jgi:hypothetical protein